MDAIVLLLGQEALDDPPILINEGDSNTYLEQLTLEAVSAQCIIKLSKNLVCLPGRFNGGLSRALAVYRTFSFRIYSYTLSIDHPEG